MVDVCANPTLMLNFQPNIPGIAYVDLTQDEDAVVVPPLRGNIAPLRRTGTNSSDIKSDNTSSVKEESWGRVA